MRSSTPKDVRAIGVTLILACHFWFAFAFAFVLAP